MRPTINIVREAGAHYVHSFYLRNLSGVTGEGQLSWPEGAKPTALSATDRGAVEDRIYIVDLNPAPAGPETTPIGR